MKILVCGNINSGKSYVIEKLHSLLPNYKILKIDEFRKKYGDGSIKGESLAIENFINKVIDLDNLIVELTGLGPLAINLQEKIGCKDFIILFINTPLEICLKRIKNKKFSDTPYPKVEEKIDETIKRINRELIYGKLNELWKSKALQIIEVNNILELNKIPFLHYHYTIGIINKLKKDKNICEIIIYGSLARKELTKLSDVDLFITTNYTINGVYNMFKDLFQPTFSDMTENKITLRYNDILIEIVVVKKVFDNSFYYANSFINNIESTVIKGNNKTIEVLKGANVEFMKTMGVNVNETIKRLMYFVLSMDNIAKKGDDYKFFFHNNIIIHEIVKLLHFAKGEFKYSYLPPMALNNCKEIEINKLVYDFDKDKYKHIKLLKKTTEKVLDLIGCNEPKYLDIL